MSKGATGSRAGEPGGGVRGPGGRGAADAVAGDRHLGEAPFLRPRL